MLFRCGEEVLDLCVILCCKFRAYPQGCHQVPMDRLRQLAAENLRQNLAEPSFGARVAVHVNGGDPLKLRGFFGVIGGLLLSRSRDI